MHAKVGAGGDERERKGGERETVFFFSTAGFLRPETQVRRFGRKLNALDYLLCKILMPIFKNGFRPP